MVQVPSEVPSASHAAAIPPLTATSTEPEVREPDALVASFAAGDAIVHGGVLVVLEPNLLIVTGRSMHDAQALWHTSFQPKAEGLHSLMRLGAERALVRTGRSLTVLEVADGRTVAKHFQGTADRRFLWERAGACGLRGDCSMQLIDCESAAPMAEPLAADHSKMRRFVGLDGQHHDTGCFGFDVDLLGRSGDIIVYFARAVRGAGHDRSFGMDARTGKLAWRSPDYGCGSCLGLERGMSPDGRHCWVAESDQIRAFDCQTGKLRFKRRLPDVQATVWAGDGGGGIFVLGDDVATLLDPRSGAPQWQVTVPAGALALPVGAKLFNLFDVAFPMGDRSVLALLDLSTGREVSRLPMTRGSAVLTAPDGRIVVRQDGMERDHTGQLIPSPDGPALIVDRGRSPGTVAGPPDQAVVRTQSGTIIDRIDADAWTIGQARVAEEVYVAVLVAREPREVRLYRAPP